MATGAASTNVAFNPVEQLSASLVTSPVAVTVLSYVQVAPMNISVSAGAENVGAVLSSIVITWVKVAEGFKHASLAIQVFV